jgi:hypothetical protein
MMNRFAAHAFLSAFALAPAALGAQGVAMSAASAGGPSLIDPSSTYYACYVPSAGTVYRIKTPSTPSACTKSTHVEFSWNHQGPVGPQGPKGDPGVVTLPYSSTMSSAGNLFEIINSGSGVAGRFSGGAGIALSAKAVTGVGVHAASAFGAAALKAEHSSTKGTAIEVTRGAIRVAGAGLNSATAAFVVQGPSGSGMSGVYTITLDNPLINGDPNALLFVTRQGLSNRERLFSHYVFYVNGTWYLRFKNETALGWEDFNPAPSFNILVIKS